MTQDCHYHPDTSARWQCLNCQLAYCNRCMPDARPRQQLGLCPHCGERLQYLTATDEIQPFWNRISSFFRYPFHSAPLLVIAICTLVPAIPGPGLVTLVISLFLLLALFKYAYTVLSVTANGQMEPPPLAEAFSGEGFSLALKQFLVFLLMGGLVWSAGLLGGGILAVATLAFLVLALPASVMILAMEQEVLAAVNPANLASLMARIGWPYFVLYAHLILLGLASGAAQDFVLTHFSLAVALLVSGFISSTFLLIFFHMMGYLLYQYQSDLGFTAEGDETETPAPDRSLRIDADIDMNIKDGHYDRAQEQIEGAVKSRPDNPWRLEQLYRLVVARNDSKALFRHRDRFLKWLSARQDGGALQELLSRLTEVDPSFHPDDPALEVECAQVLVDSSRYKQAIRLLHDCHKRYPDSDSIAPACLLLARALAEGLGRWEKATAFLNYIRKNCHNHPLHGQIETYLAQARNRQPLVGEVSMGGNNSQAIPSSNER